jgi:endonuclease YncB( thermonuclease family)
MICRMQRTHLTFRALALRSFTRRSLLLAGLTLAVLVHAHPGSVGADGCHQDSAHGKRHCHPERRAAHKHAAALPKFSADRPPRPGDEGVFFGPLVRVADGDTLRVKVQGVGMDFRLSQIDAPEKKQPYGDQARAELLRLVSGRQLVLVPVDTDRYGRTVADVWVGNRNVNRELVKSGNAWFYDEFSQDAALYALEQQARSAKRGLWALPAAQRIEPWRWRREQR